MNQLALYGQIMNDDISTYGLLGQMMVRQEGAMLRKFRFTCRNKPKHSKANLRLVNLKEHIQCGALSQLLASLRSEFSHDLPKFACTNVRIG